MILMRAGAASRWAKGIGYQRVWIPPMFGRKKGLVPARPRDPQGTQLFDLVEDGEREESHCFTL